MRRKHKYLPPKKKTYAIVVDGETEVWYFQMLKRNETKLQVNIEPKIPLKKTLQEQFNKVIELAESYTIVFWIIDFDNVIKETRETKKNEKSPVQYLEKYLKILDTNSENVKVIINNPCLEFWFLLHFEQTTKFYNKCSEVEDSLKKHLKNYKKSKKYFTQENNDIYLKLKPKLKNGISNAVKTGVFDFIEIEKGLCEMNKFFEMEEIRKHILD